MTDHAAAPPRKKRSAGRDLPAAIAVGVGLVALLVLTLAFWHWGFILLAALMLSLGAIEVHQAMKRLGMNAAIIPIVLGTVGMIVGTYAAATVPDALLWRMPWHSVLLMFLGATVLAAPTDFTRGREPSGVVQNTLLPAPSIWMTPPLAIRT